MRARSVVRLANVPWRPYDRYGEPVAGLEWCPLGGTPHDGVYESFLIRFAPGARSRPHEHTGHEEFVVLDGVLIDEDGTEFVTGDYVHFAPGSRHSSHAPDGCVLLVMLRGNNRALTKAER